MTIAALRLRSALECTDKGGEVVGISRSSTTATSRMSDKSEDCRINQFIAGSNSLSCVPL